jgi:DNA-binding transcriptional MerR regulator
MALQQAQTAKELREGRLVSEADERGYSISDLAREFNVSLRTLRFYEDRGLIHPRREGSSRVYSGRDKIRLQMILKGKQLGFTLTEVRELIGASASAKAGAPPQPHQLALSLDQVKAQLTHLERQRGDIEDAILELRDVYQRMLALDLQQAS